MKTGAVIARSVTLGRSLVRAKRHRSTHDIELLAKAVEDQCRELQAELHPPVAGEPPGKPAPPMPDPGTGPGFNRRTQAKHDLAFWRIHREWLLGMVADRQLGKTGRGTIL